MRVEAHDPPREENFANDFWTSIVPKSRLL